MAQLKGYTRHKCLMSCHHDDEAEVQDFTQTFDHDHDVPISRSIGAGMAGDVIDCDNADYIKQRIRSLYLRDSTATIVMVGRCTWARRFVDWEVAASLLNTSTTTRNGLVALTLPSVANGEKTLPARASDSVEGANGDEGYARWWKYPTTTSGLADFIGTAFQARANPAISLSTPAACARETVPIEEPRR